MNCKTAEKLVEKYELGDLDFIETKLLKNHIKTCKSCNKNYSSLILLGGLLLSSRKTYKASLIKVFLGTSLSKVLIFSSLSFVASFSLVNNYFEKTTEKNVSYYKNQSDKAILVKEFVKKEVKKSSEKENTLRIISKHKDREIELNIKEGKIESRNER